MSSAPVVALVGPTGLLGKFTLPTFVDYAKKGDFASLRLLTRSDSEVTKKAVEDGAGKVETFVVDYTNKSSLVNALKGVDVVVSTIAWHGDAAPSNAVAEAAAEAGVKVYFPSEFGSDYDPTTFGGALYEGKKAHREYAKSLGLQIVAVASSAFAQGAFAYPYFGAGGDTWYIQGDGTIPFAVTDLADVGKYTARAVVLVHQDPKSFPERLRFYSDIKSWNEYADIKEKLTGKKINRVYVPREEILATFKAGTDPSGIFYVLKVAADTPAHDFTGISHNELLNRGQKYFTPRSYEDIITSL